MLNIERTRRPYFHFSVTALGAVALLNLVAINFGNAPAKAQESDQSRDRYAIVKTETGFVRTDKKTGTTSFCKQVGERLVCTLAAEERDALYGEIENLQAKLEALSNADEGSKPKTDKNRLSQNKESDNFDRELDRAVDVTKRTVRRFFDVVKELKREFEDES